MWEALLHKLLLKMNYGDGDVTEITSQTHVILVIPEALTNLHTGASLTLL